VPTAQPTTRSTDDAQTWALFLLLAVVWGSSFLFIKIALDEGLAPLTIVSYRALFGSVLLGLVLLARGGRLPLQWEIWKHMGFLALTNLVVPMALIAWGQQYIPSGMASILNAMVPLFTVLMAALLLHDESLKPTRAAGLAIGFVGVVLLASPSLGGIQTDENALFAVAGMAAVALAAVFYAMAAVYARRRVTGQAVIREPDGSFRAPRPAEIAFGSTFAALLMLVPLVLLFERTDGAYPVPSSGAAWFSVVWLGLLGTGFAYLLFFRLIERWGATRTTLVTYVIPVVAISLGFILLGERLRPIELLGAGLIIGGVVLVNSNLGRRVPQAPSGKGSTL
jgi:drug/metabolite transporter (DMT)-like permease